MSTLRFHSSLRLAPYRTSNSLKLLAIFKKFRISNLKLQRVALNSYSAVLVSRAFAGAATLATKRDLIRAALPDKFLK